MLLPAICLDYKLFSFHLQVLPDDDVMADLYQTAIEVWNKYFLPMQYNFLFNSVFLVSWQLFFYAQAHVSHCVLV